MIINIKKCYDLKSTIFKLKIILFSIYSIKNNENSLNNQSNKWVIKVKKALKKLYVINVYFKNHAFFHDSSCRKSG